MPNDPTPDIDVECNVVTEYGQAMAYAAQSLLRYENRMRMARSEDERTFIRKSHAEMLRRAISAHRIAFAAMTAKPCKKTSLKTSFMAWLSRVFSFFSAST